MSDISMRILKTINEKGISYGELSKMTGLPKSALQRYAIGETETIPIDRLEKIADALNVEAAYLIGWLDETDEKNAISPEGHHIGVLFDRADEKDKLLTHSVLDKYDDEDKIISIDTKRKNPGGFTEIDVYDEPAAAGLGNYLDSPQAHREQLPAFMVPKGADFGIRISGDSMEPLVSNGSVVFVKHSIAIESGKIGIFILGGSSYCKQLIVDKDNQQVRLHSANPKYEDIIVTATDELRTVGQVLVREAGQ